MKKYLFMVLLVVLYITTLEAQKGIGNYGRMFNPNTIETFEGTVESVLTVAIAEKPTYGIHLEVKNSIERIVVHLGPAWYLEKKKIDFFKDDTIVVKGSRIDYEGTPVLIAMEIQKNENLFKLRDKNGFPNWRGWQNKRGKRHKINQ